MIRVWDPLVRIFHWSLVVTFGIAWVTSEGFDTLHEWLGYTIAILIAIRLIWGLIGPRYARFTNFIKGPGTTVGYLKAIISGNEPRYLGHNPAGGAMIIALLITLGVTVWTGWLITLPQYAHSDLVRGSHAMITSVLMALVIAHIAGVFLSSKRHRENLTKSMVTGDKRSAEPGDVS